MDCPQETTLFSQQLSESQWQCTCFNGVDGGGPVLAGGTQVVQVGPVLSLYLIYYGDLWASQVGRQSIINTFIGLLEKNLLNPDLLKKR